MKPQRFHIGQEVVRTGLKINKHNDLGLSDPKLNEIVVVAEYVKYYIAFKRWLIRIEGYPRQQYDEGLFDPILPQSELEKLLANITESIEA
jgi:DNA polymerase II small subunit/DNA polymerase delta subunit B